MSAPSAILSLLQGSKSAPRSPIESGPGDAAEGDSSYFVSLVKQSIDDLDARRLNSRENIDARPESTAEPVDKVTTKSVSEPDESDERAESRSAEELAALGNPLPLPLPLPVAAPQAVPSPPLELDLATTLPLRLPATPPGLVAEIVTPAAADTQLEEFAVGMGIDRSLAKLLLQQTALDTAPRATAVGTPALAGVPNAPIAGFVATSALSDAVLNPLVGTAPAHAMSVSESVVSSFSMANSPALAAAVADIDDLSLASGKPSSDVALEFAETLSDEDVLRWRAVSHRSDWVSPLRDLAKEVGAKLEVELSQTLSDSDFAAASAALRGMTLDRLTGAAAIDTSLVSTTPGGGAAPAIAGIAAVGGASAGNVGQSPLSSSSESVMPVRVPDAALPIEQRAEEFAQQVGRRLLQQIRESRWTVSLQLDPQRLGPMDIELQLEGNQVVANVAVVNAEVRQLMESALPKLRESLDSAGLNLAGWSFAQSGSRESREFAEQFTAVGGAKTRVADEVAAVSGATSDSRDEQSTRAVDVYV